VEEPKSALGWCGWRRRTTESKTGRREGEGGAWGGVFTAGLGHAAESTPPRSSSRRRARAVAGRVASAATGSREIRRRLLATRLRGVRRRSPAPRSVSAGAPPRAYASAPPVVTALLILASSRCSARRAAPSLASSRYSAHLTSCPLLLLSGGSARACVGALQRRWRRVEREGGVGGDLRERLGWGRGERNPGLSVENGGTSIWGRG
jgi:hypothetical protein